MRTFFVCLAALWLVASPRSIAADRDAAARAFAAGDHTAALELYDAVLAEHPDDELALLRTGKLLSWSKRFDEALARYERLLQVRPGQREAALERAKVLSWDGRHSAAAQAFRDYLVDHPDDADARLALARCLSWNAEHEAARAEFRHVLERRPEETDAMVGAGRTHAWTGEHREARAWYERALAVDPDHLDAQVGLAYLELWSGDPARADAIARKLAAAHPDVTDVEELRRRTAAARGPWVRATADRVDDTDDNRLNIYTLRAGWGLPRGVDVSAGVARHEMRDPSGNARIDHVGADVAFRPGRGQLLTVVLGLDERETTAGETDSDVVGGAHWLWGRDRRWQFRAAARRQTLKYNPGITDNGILIDELSAGANGRVGDAWRVHAGLSAGDYSDDNDRLLATAGFSRVVLRRPLELSAGIGLRWMDFGENTDSGYFDPQDFTSALAHLRGGGEVGERQRYRFSLDTGVQSFTLNGVDTDGDFVVIVSAGWTFELAGGLDLELHGEWGDYAGLSAAGFESRQFGINLLWRGGERP